MPRTARAAVAGMWDHALNRGNRRAAVFPKPGDSDASVEAIIDARARLPVDLLGSGLIPNHFHRVLRTRGDGDLGRWMQWSRCWRPTRAALIGTTAPAATSGRADSRPFPSRTTTLPPPCSAPS